MTAYVIWGDLASGHTGCNSNATGTNSPSSCNVDGNTSVGVVPLRRHLGDERVRPGRQRHHQGSDEPRRVLDVQGERSVVPGDLVQDPLPPALGSPTGPQRYERYLEPGVHRAPIKHRTGDRLHSDAGLRGKLGGVDVVDRTGHDSLPPFQLNPTEPAYYDGDTSAPGDPTGTVANATPTNRPAGNSAARSNAWAAYWYNGNIYASHDSPMYGDFVPAGSRGLEVYGFGGPEVSGAYRLDHLNPQTQEFLISCTASMRGSLRAKKRSVLRVSVRAMGASVNGAKVTIKGPGISPDEGDAERHGLLLGEAVEERTRDRDRRGPPEHARLQVGPEEGREGAPEGSRGTGTGAALTGRLR